MPTEDLWKKFQNIRDRLKSDPQFAAAFDEDPSKALRGSGLDATLPATAHSREVRLSNLLSKMSEIERRATIDAVVGRPSAGPSRVAAVTPVANANAGANVNVGANANALANANANANANTNTNGFAPADLRGDLVQVRISNAVKTSAVSRELQRFRLSPARQSALFKAMLTDPTAIVSSTTDPQGTRLVSRQSFRGVTFEIEALAKAGEITVQKARLIG